MKLVHWVMILLAGATLATLAFTSAIGVVFLVMTYGVTW